jgi:hypothetical protein
LFKDEKLGLACPFNIASSYSQLLPVNFFSLHMNRQHTMVEDYETVPLKGEVKATVKAMN